MSRKERRRRAYEKACAKKLKKQQKREQKAQKKEKKLSVQKTIAYREMGKDGICRVKDKVYSKTIRFYDLNYQLAQNEDKNAIFENWCDFLNYFDSTIHFQLSFINQKNNMQEFEKIIRIKPQHDAFDDVRMEYAQMLKNQLAKGNNGLMKTKYITFSIEADNIKDAKPKLERIEADILNNFKVLGVLAYPLSGSERLEVLYETFNPENNVPLKFDYSDIIRTGLGTKDYIAPSSFTFKTGKDFTMGNTIGTVSYLQILAPELTDKMLEITTLTINNSSHGTPCAMKVACTVWAGAKGVKASDLSAFLLKEEQTAAYSVEIWKRFRKWGGIPTGITQNVKDLLASREIENIFENSDFIYMLNQAAGDRQILAKQLNISPYQLSYVTNSGEGEGLLFYGSTIIPFKDKFDKNLKLYSLMTTKPEEVEARRQSEQKVAEQTKKEV